VREPVSSLVWQRSVRTVDEPAGAVVGETDAGPGELEPAPVDLPVDVLADDVPPAEIPPTGSDARRAEDGAADTDPENEQADSVRTASSAAGTGRAPRERKVVMPPR
jgi:hypothetical protein